MKANMTKDYKSFSGIAKVRFRNIATELGYKQLSGTVYTQYCGGWSNSFNLQKSSGNDFFYVNFGISIPNLWTLNSKFDENDLGGLILSQRLHNSGRGGFDCSTKHDIEDSAIRVLKEYRAKALPWFESIQSTELIAKEFYEINNISWEDLGGHTYYSQRSVASYGFLLHRAGKIEEALLWLNEAKRLMTMPVYYLQDGSIAHEKEKNSRLANKENYEIEQLNMVELAINEIESI